MQHRTLSRELQERGECLIIVSDILNAELQVCFLVFNLFLIVMIKYTNKSGFTLTRFTGVKPI